MRVCFLNAYIKQFPAFRPAHFEISNLSYSNRIIRVKLSLSSANAFNLFNLDDSQIFTSARI